MAEKAAKGASPEAIAGTPPVEPEPGFSTIRALLLLLAAAVLASISQLSLSPTHGSIPAGTYHATLINAVVFAALPFNFLLDSLVSYSVLSRARFLPVLAAWAPLIRLYLVPATRSLDVTQSALVVEAVTYAPFLFLTLNVAWHGMDGLVAKDFHPSTRKFLPIFLAGASFMLLHGLVAGALPGYVGVHWILTRPLLPALATLFTIVVIPPQLLLFTALPLLHTLFLNVHSPLKYPTSQLVHSLDRHNFTLIDRQESVTGYISVLESRSSGFRVLRCDHSLLGGEWIQGLGDRSGQGGDAGRRNVVGEPVFAVFVLLEAVRLVRPLLEPEHGGAAAGAVSSVLATTHVADSQAKALVIGLGIGTTPSGLIMHGINTTVVEIDPVVHRFAQQYFNLPANHTVAIKDAALFVKAEEQRLADAVSEDGEYDYIVHDVFTGGAVPLELFTLEFITGLSRLLKADGSIAINYVADMLLPTAPVIVRTVTAVFPSCRLFRDHSAEEYSDTSPTTSSSSGSNSSSGGAPRADFANMVLFCRKQAGRFGFREPAEADFLGTESRRLLLRPQHELDIDGFMAGWAGDAELARLAQGRPESPEAGVAAVLTGSTVKRLGRWQAASAAAHWKAMRGVLPDQVWELW